MQINDGIDTSNRLVYVLMSIISLALLALSVLARSTLQGRKFAGPLFGSPVLRKLIRNELFIAITNRAFLNPFDLD